MKNILSQIISKLKTSFEKLKLKAKKIKKELRVLYLACQRPDIPWYTKLIAILVVGYALSPVDLIPDFVPVLGYLDDIIIVPAGIALVIKLIPQNILEECREKENEAFKDGKPKNWIAGTLIIGLWIILIALIIEKILKMLHFRA